MPPFCNTCLLYTSALELAFERKCRTAAFPLISSGAYGYPKDQALKTAVDTIGDFLLEHEMTVYLVVFDRAAYDIGGKLFADIAAYIDDVYVSEHSDSREPVSYTHLDVYKRQALAGPIEKERLLKAHG